MRNSFVKTITEMAAEDPSIMLVIGDTGFGAFEEFEAKFPGRFINVGIAEQQFVGFSAGLALSGMKVVAYNVCTFMSRAMEQIRLELSYQKAGVVLVGVGGGFSYATGGPTHHAVEDISQFRAFPDMSVICPADPLEMEKATRQAINSSKPCYIRICKNNDPILHTEPFEFKVGKGIIVKEGSDAAIIATGGMVKEALATVKILEKSNISCRVISMHTIKPLDKDLILECAKKFSAIFTMEENTIVGGLGGAVAEVLTTNTVHPNVFNMFGFPDTHARVTGTRDYLNTYYKIDPQSMAEDIIKQLKNRS
jgi:transketolase